MKRTLGICAVLLYMLYTPVLAQAQEPTSFSSEKLSDQLYMIYGGGGNGCNVGLFVGEQGLLLIDAMLPKSSERLLAAIRTISDKPVTHVINTHSDADHAGGNAFFAERGATIYAQENAQYEGVTADVYIKESLTLSIDNEEIDLHAIISHSSNDLIIRFKHNNVVFMGDTFTNSWYGTFSTGGMEGQFDALNLALAQSDEQSRIIPGHGRIAHKGELAHYKEVTRTWVSKIRTLHAQGLDEETIARDASVIELAHRYIRPEGLRTISPQSMLRFVQRSISSDAIAATYQIPKEANEAYVGEFEYEDGVIESIVEQNGTLFIRKKKPYPYVAELIPLTDQVFHIRGGIHERIYIAFDSDSFRRVITYTNGDETFVAKEVVEED